MLRNRKRGATLIEILISLLLITIGMLGLFATLSSVTYGSSTSNRMAQAQLRAQSIVEAVRLAPDAVLACLATATDATTWAACETTCLSSQNADMGGSSYSPSATSSPCVFTIGTMVNIPGPKPLAVTGANPGQTVDRSNQPYALVFDGTRLGRDTFVTRTGAGGRVYNVQVSVGWNDSGSTNVTAGAAGAHAVTLRSGVFR